MTRPRWYLLAVIYTAGGQDAYVKGVIEDLDDTAASAGVLLIRHARVAAMTVDGSGRMLQEAETAMRQLAWWHAGRWAKLPGGQPGFLSLCGFRRRYEIVGVPDFLIVGDQGTEDEWRVARAPYRETAEAKESGR
jgi:hypothetical protein